MTLVGQVTLIHAHWANRTEQLATRQELHWSITSIVNRPFNSRLLLTARRAVYGINSLFNGLLTGCLWLFMMTSLS